MLAVIFVTNFVRGPAHRLGADAPALNPREITLEDVERLDGVWFRGEHSDRGFGCLQKWHADYERTGRISRINVQFLRFAVSKSGGKLLGKHILISGPTMARFRLPQILYARGFAVVQKRGHGSLSEFILDEHLLEVEDDKQLTLYVQSGRDVAWQARSFGKLEVNEELQLLGMIRSVFTRNGPNEVDIEEALENMRDRF